MKKVLFISSTGGHLRELLQLKEIFNSYDYYIVTEKDKSTVDLKNKYKNRIKYLPYGTRSKPVSYIFRYSYLIIKTLYIFLKIKPDIIISTGSHTAVPMCYLSKIFGKKVIYIETFANITKKTLAGRMVYPISDLFIVQWEKMKELYPKAVCID